MGITPTNIDMYERKVVDGDIMALWFKTYEKYYYGEFIEIREKQSDFFSDIALPFIIGIPMLGALMSSLAVPGSIWAVVVAVALILVLIKAIERKMKVDNFEKLDKMDKEIVNINGGNYKTEGDEVNLRRLHVLRQKRNSLRHKLCIKRTNDISSSEYRGMHSCFGAATFESVQSRHKSK